MCHIFTAFFLLSGFQLYSAPQCTHRSHLYFSTYTVTSKEVKLKQFGLLWVFSSYFMIMIEVLKNSVVALHLRLWIKDGGSPHLLKSALPAPL